jgi:hypothetical protein
MYRSFGVLNTSQPHASSRDHVTLNFLVKRQSVILEAFLVPEVRGGIIGYE